ncbi:MAG: nodulation protein NfeD [Candidatus Omnitrophica bacterium]|nr:nodulation protein NfeD [Candidatus Omnitrophota bacterium]
MTKKRVVFITIILAPILLLFNTYLNAQDKIKDSRIDVVKIDNYIINPVTTKFICDAIDESTKNRSICLIIELDTPGGLLESTRTIVKKILNSEVPIVTYISPSGSRAGSAGVFITYASHIAAMAPSTNIGAAHPIGIGFTPTMEKKEKDKKGESKDVLSEKIMSDLLAWIEGIAKTRKRNVRWVKKAVTESASATETEAVKQNIVDFLAIDLEELINKIDGMKVETKYGKRIIHAKDARINFLELSNREKILNTIAHPNIAYILMMLGIIGLIFEFSHPGIGFPGIAGLICILLAFYSFQLMPINYVGLLLIILAVVLLIAEALTPTFGLLTLGGIVSFVFGSLMLIKSPYPFLKISLHVIIPVIASIAAITIFLVANAVKVHRKKVSTGKEGLIDATATAMTKINKKGRVFLHGEIWTAYNTKKETIKKGDEVKVIKVEGLKLYIEKIK